MVKHVFIMRKFVITEEQYRALTEINGKFDLAATPVNAKKVGYTGNDQNGQTAAVASEVSKQGLSNKITVKPDTSSTNANGTQTAQTQTTGTQPINCGRVITKKQIAEGMLAALKKDTKVYTVKDFLTR